MDPIRLTQTIHVVQYLLQALLMGALVMWAGGGLNSPGAGPPPALGPYVILAALLVLMVGSSLYTMSRYLRPNLRRPSAENHRVFRSRLILRNSLLGLLALPPLLLYQSSGQFFDLLYYGVMFAGLLALNWPTARGYQQWLIS
ncbi:hypothetical protein [Solirubrum puertoriconensis]|uniref:Uncharacterized protein n=1 Tax=Solirubrum puertoriconensis TaxID=1751427 RepID=A0A9X0HLW1_SOLP1|nr:hypothetical protein [Solirubrum puertoriconensis]KUG08349.1 hypothetical protein ASU33_09265 [Solirubrum puertoriconensis]